MKQPVIKSTTDYSLFQANPFQRAFSEAKVAILAKKMKANGYKPSMAISVFLRNGKLVINTGHHRLAAAKLLGIAILYVIEDQWTPEQLVDEGTTTRAWDIVSAAQCFARKGDKDYQALLDYADKGIPIGMAASLLIGEGAASGNARRKVIEGTFRITTKAHAGVFVDIFEEFGEKQESVKSRSFIAALSKCLMTKEFDLHTFRKRLRDNPTMLEKTSSTDQMLRLIEDIYNFRAMKKIPLSFLATDQSVSRKHTFGRDLA